MRRHWIFLGAIGGLGALLATAFVFAYAAEEQKPVESFLPADSALYIGWDGVERHKEAWEQTAAYEALEKSGLLGTLTRLALSYVPTEHRSSGEAVRDVVRSLARKGFSLSVSFPKGSDGPIVVLVLQDAAPLEALLGSQLPKLLGRSATFESSMIRGRRVIHVRSTGGGGGGGDAGIDWWSEGGHLIGVYGKRAVESVLDVAEGKSPAIGTTSNWRTYRAAKGDFATVFCGWLDVAALKGRFENFVLQQPSESQPRMTVGQLLKVLGIERMGSVACRCGFRDRALVSDFAVEAPSPRTGLLALLDQRSITLADLPPLPKSAHTFVAASFDWSKAYDLGVKLAHDIANQVTRNGSTQVDAFLDQLPTFLGFDPKRDLCDRMGNVICLYDDNAAPIPGGFGFGLAIQVKDADVLKKTLKTAFDRLQAQFPNGLTIAQEERMGREVSLFGIGPLPFQPAVCVDKQWLFVGLSPQSVESALLRVDGKLESWQPSKSQTAALEFAPKKFQMLSLSDPRPIYTALVTYLPLLVTGIDQAMKGQGQEPGQAGRASGKRFALLSELPPPELLTRSMFPNVSAWTVDDRGMHGRSRESAPGLAGAGGIAVTAVAVALILPAVQAAREAARRTQSKNNIKQILLALHNYHDSKGHFPAGTHPNKDLKPEKRLSWLADVLPYLEQSALQQRINFGKAWDDPANGQAVLTPITVFVNPSQPRQPNEKYPVTDYVGLAGLGPEGPTLPVDSPKAGCFGYDRVTKIRDIVDGLSNTAMICEVSKHQGPWAAGGRPTIRPLTKKPYINGPDGLGGSHPGGCQIGMADGSVRFFSDQIDPALMEALVTIAGKERLEFSNPNP